MNNQFEHNEGRAPQMKDVEAIMSALRPAKSSNPPINGLNLLNMMRAKAGGYPKHMYHETLKAQYVLNEDQENELMAMGYVHNWIPQEYPKALYRRNMNVHFEAKYEAGTNILLAEPFIETRVVNDEVHEKELHKRKPEQRCGPWMDSITKVEPIPDGPNEDPLITIARLEGQLEAGKSKAA